MVTKFIEDLTKEYDGIVDKYRMATDDEKEIFNKRSKEIKATVEALEALVPFDAILDAIRKLSPYVKNYVPGLVIDIKDVMNFLMPIIIDFKKEASKYNKDYMAIDAHQAYETFGIYKKVGFNDAQAFELVLANKKLSAQLFNNLKNLKK